MDKVQAKIQEWNVEKMVKAVAADDPDVNVERLRNALNNAKNGNWGRVHKSPTSPIVETRNYWGLSQSKFAEKLGISVATLRSWESGNRKPSGAAAVLLNLLHKRPELVGELNHL